KVKLPAIEQIIGPIALKDLKAWGLAYAYLRSYSSSPPGGDYCFEDDCYGTYNPRLDNSHEGLVPSPPQDPPPGVPPTTGMIISMEPGGPTTRRDSTESFIRLALAGAEQPQLEFAQAKKGTTGTAPPVTRDPCPVDPARLDRIKKQAQQILDVARAPTTEQLIK